MEWRWPAALARAGEFEEAVQIQERLVAAATDPEHLPSYRLRLEGYKEGYPWAEYARGGGYVDRD